MVIITLPNPSRRFIITRKASERKFASDFALSVATDRSTVLLLVIMIVHRPIVFLLFSFLYHSNGFAVNRKLIGASGNSAITNFQTLSSCNVALSTRSSQSVLLRASNTDTPEKEKNIRGKAAFALTALVVQNSALALLMRLSRVTTKSSSKMYIVSTAVVLSEFIKVVVSLLGCYYEDAGKDVKKVWGKISDSSKSRDLLKISVPAALYVLQNNLQYVAMSNLPAEVYQVLIQGKIITTALFSVLLLNKRYSFIQWTSVLMLSLGVALVQFSLKTSIVSARNVNFAIGITSVLVSTLTSGFASVFLEKMLKSKGGFWVRNIQLSFVSFLIASIGSLIKDSGSIIERGFFADYNPLVLSVILTQALGGMLVAFVVRYTNSIVKGFAASGSIILSCIVSAIFLSDYKLNKLFTVGTGMVCASALAWAVSPTPTIRKAIGATESGFNEIKARTDTVINNVEASVVIDEIVPEDLDQVCVGASADYSYSAVASSDEPI